LKTISVSQYSAFRGQQKDPNLNSEIEEFMAAKEVLSQEVVKFAVTIRTLTEMLGTSPSDPNIASNFVISKALDNVLFKAVSKEDRERIRKAIVDQELKYLPVAQRGLRLLRFDLVRRERLLLGRSAGGSPCTTGFARRG
jgi:hypothetical protein